MITISDKSFSLIRASFVFLFLIISIFIINNSAYATAIYYNDKELPVKAIYQKGNYYIFENEARGFFAYPINATENTDPYLLKLVSLDEIAKNNELQVMHDSFTNEIYLEKSINSFDTNYEEVVNPYQVYSYQALSEDLEKLSLQYPSLIKKHSIGKSEFGREIWAVALGRGEVNVLITGSHHAREWMTTTLCTKMIDYYAKAYQDNEMIDGINVRETLNKTTIWFIPMVNPDGVSLQQEGLSQFEKKEHQRLLDINKGSADFKTWKADALGIDLNKQYDLNWGNNINSVWSRGSKNYQGEYAHQSKEVIATVDLVEKIRPEILIAYHSSGEVIFWTGAVSNENYSRNKAMADKISNLTKYPLGSSNTASNPAGSMSPWFRATYDKPATTVEIGRYKGEYELPLTEWDRLWEKNKAVGLVTALEGYHNKVNRQ